MLSQAQVETFHSQGYLVVENVLPMQVIDAVVQEYTSLMCELYGRWAVEGRVPRGVHDFWAQLSAAYAAGATGSSRWTSACRAERLRPIARCISGLRSLIWWCMTAY